MTDLTIRLYLRLRTALVALVAMLAPKPAPAGASRTRRAATFIEYGLLVAVAVGIILFIFREQFEEIVGTLLDRLECAIDSGTSSGDSSACASV